MSEKINCYEGEIIDWNWTRDYGIARIIRGPNTGNEVFVHYSNVKIQAKDDDGNPLMINGKPWYGREAAENFFFNSREPVKDMRKNQIWFDLYERIWFVLDDTKPNLALAVTWSEEDSIEKYNQKA